ncbi:nuclear protein UL24 [Spheniscid alphaherpesvirus 1]|uniref:Nuclear protein UL24 n=1 Tax=Spheniscid alphaherpesvirus 1 TaxID=2560777 RepID=A0A1R3T450_9ALPH|nr:nuclear protein UL24 [Spheniscid alphaherpesvirus 1]SCO83559.1 nuclear protein UL24 [Spheniscid alphaherpesvirus 1]
MPRPSKYATREQTSGGRPVSRCRKKRASPSSDEVSGKRKRSRDCSHVSIETTTKREVRRRLGAGVRCHNRFYAALTEDMTMLRSGGEPTELVNRVFGTTLPISVLKEADDVVLAFEVNLGRRRPDCVCMIRTRTTDDEAEVLCVLLELKTCRFSGNMRTVSKRQQKVIGMQQLVESTRLMERIMPSGTNRTLICPILVFVAQRGLSVLTVSRLNQRLILSNFTAFSVTITGLAEYHPPVPRKRGRKPKRVAVDDEKTWVVEDLSFLGSGGEMNTVTKSVSSSVSSGSACIESKSGDSHLNLDLDINVKTETVDDGECNYITCCSRRLVVPLCCSTQKVQKPVTKASSALKLVASIFS